MYMAISDHAVSSVLIRQHEGVQKPIHYLSKTLVDVETWYLPLQKMVLALVHVTRKLLHYFQAYTMWVLTKHPLQSLFRRLDFTGRIAKWRARLGTFDIHYKPRNSIKGQVLANFVAEFAPRLGPHRLYARLQLGHGRYMLMKHPTHRVRGLGLSWSHLKV